MADIKTKEKVRSSIKTFNHSTSLSSKMKHSALKNRERAGSATENDGSLSDYASREIERETENAFYASTDMANSMGRKSFLKTKQNTVIAKGKINERRLRNEQIKTIEKNAGRDMIKRRKLKSDGSAEVKRSIEGNIKGRTYAASAPKVKTRPENVKGNNVFKGAGEVRNRAMQKKAYHLAKQNVINKQLTANNLNKTIRTSEKGIKGLVYTVKHGTVFAIQSFKAMMSAIVAGGWIAVIVIVICCLFGAAIHFFGDSTSGFTKVSPEVEAYTSIITKYAREYEIPDYVELIKAVMMQESAGKGKDPMQSSACKYNTKYPNGINDPEYSIKCGVAFLSELLKKSECEYPIDLEHIRLALQSYNYGEDYLNWAVKKDGGYTVSNADEYSKKKAEEMGIESYGDKMYVSHVLRYYPYGNYNYGVGNGVIVKVAEEQVGNIGGEPYWKWYGFNTHVEWCACFVSWCADQCGYIENGIIPKYAVVSDGINWFKARGQYQNRKYEPQPGDIIFFDWENDGLADHTGIVKSCEDGIVTTIEGNSHDRCVEKTYRQGATFINGYGVPKY